MEDRPRRDDRFGGDDDRRGGRREKAGRYERDDYSSGYGRDERPARGGRFEREERFAPRRESAPRAPRAAGPRSNDRDDRSSERAPRADRAERPERSSVGMVSLRINVGKKHRILPKDIVGCFAHVAGLDGSQIGAIRLGPEWTNVDVAEEAVDAVVDRVSETKLKGIKLRVTEERR
jgi:ATP-dependent RNA helicase DeaD